LGLKLRLDVATEQQVQETIEQVSRGRSVLFVTHRLQQASRCDHIVVLDKGRMLESTFGEHDAKHLRSYPPVRITSL
jgi:ABC-type transport system involved in cytochrome bd biosynthesis fused ATPase/permease subunit